MLVNSLDELYCKGMIKRVKRIGYRPAAEVYLQSVIGEVSSGMGTLACIERGCQADVVIVIKPHVKTLGVAQVRVIWRQIEVKRPSAHGMEPWQRVTAI